MPKVATVAKLAVFLSLALSVASAQISTGTIVGAVEDNTGGVVPNASVTLTQTATGQARQTQTNDHGQFNAPFLPLGSYSRLLCPHPASRRKPSRELISRWIRRRISTSH